VSVPGESGRRYHDNWRLFEATLEPPEDAEVVYQVER
jgi:hypothetical protein